MTQKFDLGTMFQLEIYTRWRSEIFASWWSSHVNRAVFVLIQTSGCPLNMSNNIMTYKKLRAPPSGMKTMNSHSWRKVISRTKTKNECKQSRRSQKESLEGLSHISIWLYRGTSGSSDCHINIWSTSLWQLYFEIPDKKWMYTIQKEPEGSPAGPVTHM